MTPTPPANRPECIVIGTSAGALDALSAILPALPADFPCPVLVVVHLPAHRDSLMAEILRPKCRLPVREVEDKEPIEPATIYIAAPDYHLLIEPDRRLSLSSEELVHYSRPAIDVLFESSADVYGPSLVGIVLTGANYDGAAGLRKIADAGGIAIVQRPEEAEADAMPRAALKACPRARVMSLAEIATFLVETTTTV